MMQNKRTSSNLVKLIVLALLGTISLLLFFLNFPIPMLPPYLKIDFSDIPAIIAAFIFTPVAGVIVVAIKNLLYLAVAGSADPIGVSANFLAGVLFTVPISMVYHKYKKGVKSVVSGLIAGTVVMAIGMTVLNYLIILPAYAWFTGMDISEAGKLGAVLIGVLPFNILKGVVVGSLFVVLFTRMKHWIEEKRTTLT